MVHANGTLRRNSAGTTRLGRYHLSPRDLAGDRREIRHVPGEDAVESEVRGILESGVIETRMEFADAELAGKDCIDIEREPGGPAVGLRIAVEAISVQRSVEILIPVADLNERYEARRQQVGDAGSDREIGPVAVIVEARRIVEPVHSAIQGDLDAAETVRVARLRDVVVESRGFSVARIVRFGSRLDLVAVGGESGKEVLLGHVEPAGEVHAVLARVLRRVVGEFLEHAERLQPKRMARPGALDRDRWGNGGGEIVEPVVLGGADVVVISLADLELRIDEKTAGMDPERVVVGPVAQHDRLL